MIGSHYDTERDRGVRDTPATNTYCDFIAFWIFTDKTLKTVPCRGLQFYGDKNF